MYKCSYLIYNLSYYVQYRLTKWTAGALCIAPQHIVKLMFAHCSREKAEDTRGSP